MRLWESRTPPVFLGPQTLTSLRPSLFCDHTVVTKEWLKGECLAAVVAREWFRGGLAGAIVLLKGIVFNHSIVTTWWSQ
jgi:hypothetical protein